jgi:hypothetical protein
LENLKGRDYFRDQGIDRRIILKCIFKKLGVSGWNGFIWLKDRDQWRALVNTVMNLQVPLKVGSFLTN